MAYILRIGGVDAVPDGPLSEFRDNLVADIQQYGPLKLFGYSQTKHGEWHNWYVCELTPSGGGQVDINFTTDATPPAGSTLVATGELSFDGAHATYRAYH